LKRSFIHTDSTLKLKRMILEMGADLVGVADLDLCREIPTIPNTLFNPYTRALAIAVQLPISVFEMITDQPTPIYDAVYQTANRLLDEIALRTAILLQNKGWRSLPIPASQVLDRINYLGAVSHKAIARMAGLGWQGKNLLLITPDFGSRVRLVTVLTNAPLTPDQPMANRCGKCTQCRDACPVNAIKGVSTDSHYSDRNEAMHFDQCAEKLTQHFARLPGIGAPICGICIKVCPFGRHVKKKKAK
jgi:epoxyqueuosine reductase